MELWLRAAYGGGRDVLRGGMAKCMVEARPGRPDGMGQTRDSSWRGDIAQTATNSCLRRARRAVAEAVSKGGERDVEEEWVACGAKGTNFRDSQKALAYVAPALS